MRYLRKPLLITMMGVVIIAILNFVGCNYNSEKKLKEIITSALEEKYDEAFVCFDVWANGGSSYWGICAPEKNQDIRFTSLFNSNGNIVEEGYYASCVAEQIEEDVQSKLENVFNDFYLHSYMTVPLYSYENDDIYSENVRNELFDIDEYVSYVKEKRECRTSITLIMLVNREKPDVLNFAQEYKALSDLCENIKKHNINPRVYLKFMPKDKYSECIEYLEIKDSTSSYFDDMVRDYPIKASDMSLDICFEFEGDTPITITQEEYIKQRKEVS